MCVRTTGFVTTKACTAVKTNPIHAFHQPRVSSWVMWNAFKYFRRATLTTFWIRFPNIEPRTNRLETFIRSSPLEQSPKMGLVHCVQRAMWSV